MILGSVSAIALSIVGATAAIKSPEGKEYISFNAARDQFDFILNDQTVQSEKAFGVKYDTKALRRR